MSSSPKPYSLPWHAARYDADDALRIYRDIQADKGRHSTISIRGGALIESWPETPPKDKKNLKKLLAGFTVEGDVKEAKYKPIKFELLGTASLFEMDL